MIDEQRLAVVRKRHGEILSKEESNEIFDTLEDLWTENAQLKIVKESLQREADGLVENCRRWSEYVHKLQAVASAADSYQRFPSAHDRAVLKEALAALKACDCNCKPPCPGHTHGTAALKAKL